MLNLKNKKGKVQVTCELIYDGTCGRMFQKFFPFHIEREFNGVFTYFGVSECFRELKEGEKIPEYSFNFRFLPNFTSEYVCDLKKVPDSELIGVEEIDT